MSRIVTVQTVSLRAHTTAHLIIQFNVHLLKIETTLIN